MFENRGIAFFFLMFSQPSFTHLKSIMFPRFLKYIYFQYVTWIRSWNWLKQMMLRSTNGSLCWRALQQKVLWYLGLAWEPVIPVSYQSRSEEAKESVFHPFFGVTKVFVNLWEFLGPIQREILKDMVLVVHMNYWWTM